MDASTVLDRLNAFQSFSRTDLQAIMNQGKSDTTASIANHMIDQLLNAGGIIRIGRNRYMLSNVQGFDRIFLFQTLPPLPKERIKSCSRDQRLQQ